MPVVLFQGAKFLCPNSYGMHLFETRLEMHLLNLATLFRRGLGRLMFHNVCVPIVGYVLKMSCGYQHHDPNVGPSNFVLVSFSSDPDDNVSVVSFNSFASLFSAFR